MTIKGRPLVKGSSYIRVSLVSDIPPPLHSFEKEAIFNDNIQNHLIFIFEHDNNNNNNNNNMPAFIHALWIADPSKRAKGLNMQPSPQMKGGARVTSILYVTPYSLQKGLQL